MSKRVRLSIEEKLKSVKSVLDGLRSINAESKRIGVSPSTLSRWIVRYKKNGIDGLKESTSWKLYPKELKQAAIRDVIVHNQSQTATINKYDISSASVLKQWITKYTNVEANKSIGKGSSRKKMNKGRTTTFKERIEIVQYTIAHGLDYQKAAERYGVSYQQVYSWVKKYQASGIDSLQDGRGRKKVSEKLTEEEQLKLRIKELEAINQQLEMEVAVQKKLQEIQERFNL